MEHIWQYPEKYAHIASKNIEDTLSHLLRWTDNDGLILLLVWDEMLDFYTFSSDTCWGDVVSRTYPIKAYTFLFSEDAQEEFPIKNVTADFCNSSTSGQTNVLPPRDLYTGSKYWAAIPLQKNGCKIGVILLCSNDEKEHEICKQDITAVLLRTLILSLQESGLIEVTTPPSQEVDRRRMVAESLRDVINIVNSSNTLDDILTFITLQIKLLMHCSAVAIYGINHETGTIKIQAAQGFPEEFIREVEIPMDQGVLGRAITLGHPIAIENVKEYAREEDRIVSKETGAYIEEKHWHHFSPMLEKIGAFLTCPIFVRDQPFGGVILHYPEPRTFSGEDIDLVTMLANHAVLAIENTHLRKQMEEIAIMQERNRISRDLHDSVSQALYGVILGVKTLITLMEKCKPDESYKSKIGETLDYTLTLAQTGLEEMRALIHELRPTILIKKGLCAAIKNQLDMVQIHHGIATHEKYCDEPDVPITVKEILLRVTQEALNNVVKHAQASQIELSLAMKENNIELEIKDNGVGFDVTSHYQGRFGLRNMRERVEDQNGQFIIESKTHKGTLVRVSIPIMSAVR